MNRAVGFGGFCAAGALFLLCGCCVASNPEKQLFDRVAAELESGGSYYSIQNPVYLKQALKNLRKSAENQLWDLPLSQVKQEKIQLFFSSFELLCRISGITEIEGVGASSRRIGERKFQNTMFCALPSQAQGVLWQILPEENAVCVRELETLPENVTAAGVLKLNPQALEQKIISLYPEKKDFFSLPLLKELKGIWRFALILEPGCEPQTGHGVHLMIALPDPQKKVFNQLAAILQLMPQAKVDRKNSRIHIAPLPRMETAPLGVQKEGTLFLYSSATAEKLFGNPGKRLKDQKDFQETAARFTQPGIGIFYVQNNGSLHVLKNTLAVDCAFDDHCSIGMLERKKNGIKWSSCDPYDWNVSALQALLVPASLILEPLLLAPEPKTENVASKLEQKAPLPAKVSVDNKRCQKQLKLAAEGLLQYAKAHHKRFPEKSGIAGLKEVIPYLSKNGLRCPVAKHTNTAGELNYDNCDYLYFGNSTEKNAPLLMERPGLHGDNRLNVAFPDGHTQQFNMEKPFSVRKAVSFLHTQYHYEENEFLRLMDLAAEFDKILEL